MFRTPIQITPSFNKIELPDSIFLMGSCFSEHIGNLLIKNKFNTHTNPFGIIFNPISNNRLLNNVLQQKELDENKFGQHNDIHFHYDLHSSFSALSRDELASKYDHAHKLSYKHIQKTKWLIITWGTAIVYELKAGNEIVANCHKVPASDFNKRLLSIEEIITNTQDTLKNLSPDVQVILTVSPVRHIKETIELNSVSKSTLRLAAHELSKKHNQISYFPSFEIMMDDLRDYRFYESDMLHPNQPAIQYIWDKFSATYFDNEVQDFLSNWKKIKSAIQHKSFNPQSEKHQLFLKKTLQLVNEISSQVDVTKEVAYLENQLIKKTS